MGLTSGRYGNFEKRRPRELFARDRQEKRAREKEREGMKRERRKERKKEEKDRKRKNGIDRREIVNKKSKKEKKL